MNAVECPGRGKSVWTRAASAVEAYAHALVIAIDPGS